MPTFLLLTYHKAIRINCLFAFAHSETIIELLIFHHGRVTTGGSFLLHKCVRQDKDSSHITRIKLKKRIHVVITRNCTNFKSVNTYSSKACSIKEVAEESVASEITSIYQSHQGSLLLEDDRIRLTEMQNEIR